jgi:uncharacterized repeat protein (TIGR01451 family)
MEDRVCAQPKWFILLFLLDLAFSAVVSASTTVPPGEVSGTWSVAGSPYLVQGDVEIPAGDTLVIEPGVTVQFETEAGLSARGTLTAVGTAASLIRFTSAQTSPSPGDWEGVEIRYSSGSLAWIQIDYAVNGLSIWHNSSPTISDCTVRSNAETGIRVAASASGCSGSHAAPTITRCQVELNLGDGVEYHGFGHYREGCTEPQTGFVGGTLSGSGIHHNTGTGIVIQANDGYFTRGRADPEVLGCDIHDNGGNGILLTGDDNTGPTIHGSDVYLNAQSGILRDSPWGTATITNNELRENTGPGLRNSSDRTIVSGNRIINNNSEGVVTLQLRQFSENTLYGNADDNDFFYLDTIDQVAPQNDWGTTDPAVIDSHIWDRLDNPALGRVIASPATDFVVTPDADLDFSGQQGGPFYPVRAVWMLWNTQADSLDWEIAGAESLLSTTPLSGTLAPFDNGFVWAETGAEAESLTPGTHTAILAFQNTATGDGDTQRTIRLSVMDRHLAFVDVHSEGFYGSVVVVSPDGAHVFAASDNKLFVLVRDGVTGELTLLEEHHEGYFFGASSVTLSPDGENVYVTGQTNDRIAVYDRNPVTGVLIFLEAHRDSADGVDGLDGAVSVKVSPDGANVYVASTQDNAVAVFARDTSTGRLTFIEVQKDGVGGVVGLDHVVSLALSPDGTHIYVANYDGGLIYKRPAYLAVFARDTNTGSLTFLEVHENGVDGVDGLRGYSRVALSPDGAHVYVTSDYDSSAIHDSVALFARDTSTGTLTFRRIYEDKVDGEGLEGARELAVSGDGAYLYIASRYDDALTVFSRNAATGELLFVESHYSGVDGVHGLDGPQAVAVSPDGAHVYVGSEALFSRVSSLVADLSISKSDSIDPIAAGGAFDYTLSVTNSGPSVAWGVRVEDTLPAGVSMTDATGTGWNCGENGGLVTCSRESLDVGTAPLLTLSVTTSLGGTVITNSALVGAESSDPNTSGNNSSEQTEILLPTLVIDDMAVIEGDAGTVDAGFTVSLSAASGQEVTVDYATADGTATASSDYLTTSDTLIFDAGVTSRTVSVVVNGDLMDEPDENFLVNLSNPVNASILDDQGQGVITDDDAAPTLSIDDVAVMEGDAGTVDAVFTVSLSAASGQEVMVDYATANGTATADSDYLTTSDTLIFDAGVTSRTVTVVVNGDLLDELDETFLVSLSNPVNASISDGQGQGTITNDDSDVIFTDGFETGDTSSEH